jgi:hypothetical protein
MADEAENAVGQDQATAFLDGADWYIRCLEDIQDGRPVRGLAEAKAYYGSTRDALEQQIAPTEAGAKRLRTEWIFGTTPRARDEYFMGRIKALEGALHGTLSTLRATTLYLAQTRMHPSTCEQAHRVHAEAFAVLHPAGTPTPEAEDK